MSGVEPVWIENGDVVALHDRLLALYGGAPGVRDEGLLTSAIASASCYVETTDIIGMASAYTVGDVKNHPFVDGNKRTGFVVGVLFLELNGYRFHATEEAAAETVLALAAGVADEAAYTSFLRRNTVSE